MPLWFWYGGVVLGRCQLTLSDQPDVIACDRDTLLWIRKGELWWGGAGPCSGPRLSRKRSQQKRPVQGYLALVIQSPYQCTTSHFLSEIPHIRIIYKLRNTLKIQTAMYFVSSWSFFFFHGLYCFYQSFTFSW